jgi:hypothetical protein
VAEGFTIARLVSSGDMPLNPHVTLEEKARLVSSVVKPLALIKLRRTKCAEPRRPSCLAQLRVAVNWSKLAPTTKSYRTRQRVEQP